jgi:hypothetical protein
MLQDTFSLLPLPFFFRFSLLFALSEFENQIKAFPFWGFAPNPIRFLERKRRKELYCGKLRTSPIA